MTTTPKDAPAHTMAFLFTVSGSLRGSAGFWRFVLIAFNLSPSKLSANPGLASIVTVPEACGNNQLLLHNSPASQKAGLFLFSFVPERDKLSFRGY